MSEYIGQNLKAFAKVLLWIGIIGSIVGAIILWTATTEVSYGTYYKYTETVHPYVTEGFIMLICGILGSWVLSWALYGIGEAAENSQAQLRASQKILEKLETMNLTDKQAQTIANAMASAPPRRRERRMLEDSSPAPTAQEPVSQYVSPHEPTPEKLKRIQNILDREFSDMVWLLAWWDQAGFPEVEPYISTRKKLESAQYVEEAKEIIRQDYGIK